MFIIMKVQRGRNERMGVRKEERSQSLSAGHTKRQTNMPACWQVAKYLAA